MWDSLCMYASMKYVIISSDTGLFPIQDKALNWTNTDLLSIELLSINNNRKWTFFYIVPENASQNCKMAAILFRPIVYWWHGYLLQLKALDDSNTQQRCGAIAASWSIPGLQVSALKVPREFGRCCRPFWLTSSYKQKRYGIHRIMETICPPLSSAQWLLLA